MTPKALTIYLIFLTTMAAMGMIISPKPASRITFALLGVVDLFFAVWAVNNLWVTR